MELKEVLLKRRSVRKFTEEPVSKEMIDKNMDVIKEADAVIMQLEIPIETVEKVIVKDSVVFVTDSVYVEVPKEVIKEILPTDTTSVLSTSVATSTAKVEKGTLTHRLEQKGVIPVRIDTHYVTKIKEVEKMVEVPVEVEVIKYKRDTIFWLSIILNIAVLLIIAFKIYLKIKKIY